jgi:thiol:disulfide interchange protein DsbA
MNRRDFALTVAALGAGGIARAQGGPVEGTHYVRLSQPAPVTLPGPEKKVEVVEFFWYECPHCNAFEPLLEAWVKRLPADVAFRQVPVGFTARHQVHQRLFYALEEMGQLQAMHRRLFAAIHVQNRRVSNESEIMAFVKDQGLDVAKFGEAFKSFSVSAKAGRAKQLTDAYKIDGVPALGIHGRFYTSGALAGNHERALAVADFLIQRSRQRS